MLRYVVQSSENYPKDSELLKVGSVSQMPSNFDASSHFVPSTAFINRELFTTNADFSLQSLEKCENMHPSTLKSDFIALY